MTIATDIRPTEAPTEGDTITTAQPSLTLPLEEAIEAFSAVLPHVSKNDVVKPETESVSVAGDRLVATDRYTVAAYRLSVPATAPFLVSADLAAYVTKIAPKGLRFGHMIGRTTEASGGYTVRITDSEVPALTSVEILWDGMVERSQVFDRVTGVYPAIVRLVDDWQPAEKVVPVALSAEHLEKVLGFAKKFSKVSGDRVPVFTPGASTSSPDKPGPVRVTLGNLTALIQPNLLPR